MVNKEKKTKKKNRCFSNVIRKHTRELKLSTEQASCTPVKSYPAACNQAGVSLPYQSPFACQAMDSILDFYLSTVLPTAMAGVTEETRDLKPHVESIQQIFDELKTDVTKCVSSRQTSRSHRSAETQTRTDFTFVQVPLADMMPFSCKNRRDVVECISEDQNSPSIENDPVMTS